MKFNIELLPVMLLCLTAFAFPARGEDDAVLHALGLGKESETTAPVFRAPRPASLVAENITVVTADDIARLNARTLDEVLQTVSGVQLLQVRTPGSNGVFSLNGALSHNVLVLIDGIPQNLLGAEESAELGMIPVQRIERVEIIKGAASVAWGPALGGVVNIVTHNPDSGKKLGGSASASYGKNTTSDLRGGVSGTIGRTGYYLDGGNFHSQGLLPGNKVNLDHVFGKLTYDLPIRGRLSLGLDFRQGERGITDIYRPDNNSSEHDSSGSRYASAYLRLDYPLRDRLNLEILTAAGQRDIWQKWEITRPVQFLIFDAKNRTDSQQASVKLVWGDRSAGLTAGFEYLHDDIVVSEPKTQFAFLNFERDLNRYSAYLNGNYSLGPLTLLPGIRFDQIGGNQEVVSYHLGATWLLSEKTLLRIYAARGYSLPMVNFRNSLQNIRTLQAGIESSALPFLWTKVTFFYNNTWNIENYLVPADYPASPVSTVNSKQDRQGVEIEVRTTPWYDLSLAAGFTYNDVRYKSVTNTYTPNSVTKIALYYNNAQKGFKATVSGYHVDWPSDTGNNVHDKQMVWDIHLSQKLPSRAGLLSEIFFSGHNLFNNDQYIDNFFANAPTWLEGGIRFKF